MSLVGDNSGAVSEAEKIAQNLNEKHRDLVQRGIDLWKMRERVPEAVDNPTDADRLSEGVRVIDAFLSKTEETRVAEKAPYWEAGKAVDSWFTSLKTNVASTKAILLKVRTAYDVKVAEAAMASTKEEIKEATFTRSISGVSSSLKTTWMHRIDRPEKIPKKYLSPDDAKIRKAIKAATKPDGSCDLKIEGVTIYPYQETKVRG